MRLRLKWTCYRWPGPAAWLAWLLPVFAWAPLAYPGYFQFHSGYAPAFNVDDLARHLFDLAWAPTAGQPYDLWRGERSLPYLLALLPRSLGASGATAVKWVFAASLLLAAWGMFGWARRRLGTWPALVASAVYTLWPFGLAALYVRGALAETLLLALMPFLWWAVEAAQEGEHRRAVLLLALLAAATLWTQAGLAVWLLLSVLAVLLARRARPVALAGWLAGVGIGAIGLVPLLVQRGLGGGPWPSFADHLVYPHQLLLAGWGYGPSIAGPDDTLPLQLGVVTCALALLGGLLPRPLLSGTPATLALQVVPRARGAAVLALLPILFSLTLAAPFWRLLPGLSRTLTWPWQLLLLSGPWLAWLAGLGAQKLAALWPAGQRLADEGPLHAGLIALALLAVYPHLAPLTAPAPASSAPVARFGDHEIALLRATFAEGEAGELVLETEWQALRPLDEDYSVFVHVLAPDGTLWGQFDGMPRGGELPTSRWRPGEVVQDRYRLALKPGAPAGVAYRYWLGLYRWQTGQRLSTGSDDKVTLYHAP